jgi:phospholipid transport system substrate-binding protein
MLKRMAAFFGFTVFLIFSCTPILAADNSNPYTLMQQVADTTFKRIADDQAKINDNANHLKVIVADELMPYIDHRFAARVILYKSKVSKSQRKAFYKAFEQYLITTYATVFSKYSDQQVKFDPAMPFEGKKMVVVKTRLITAGAPDINIDFKVRKNKKTGVWKAYDLKALGVSLLDSKKAEMAALLRQQNGVEKVTQILTEKAKADIVIGDQV